MELKEKLDEKDLFEIIRDLTEEMKLWKEKFTGKSHSVFSEREQALIQVKAIVKKHFAEPDEEWLKKWASKITWAPLNANEYWGTYIPKLLRQFLKDWKEQ